MTTPDKEPLLFSRVTYAAMIMAAIGSLVTIPFETVHPMIRALSDLLFGWMMIGLAAILARLMGRSWANPEIESAAQN